MSMYRSASEADEVEVSVSLSSRMALLKSMMHIVVLSANIARMVTSCKAEEREVARPFRLLVMLELNAWKRIANVPYRRIWPPLITRATYTAIDVMDYKGVVKREARRTHST